MPISYPIWLWHLLDMRHALPTVPRNVLCFAACKLNDAATNFLDPMTVGMAWASVMDFLLLGTGKIFAPFSCS